MAISQKPNRILLLAFCCHPNGTMEERNGWNRAVLAARNHHVTVLYFPMGDTQQLAKSVPKECLGRLEFVPVELSGFSQNLLRHELTFYSGYRAWHRKVYQIACSIHENSPFDLVHSVTLCGFRVPGFAWQMGVPFLWGPLGGTHSFPQPFLSLLGWSDRIRELIRTAVNHYQLHWSRTVLRVARASTAVIAATSNAQKDFEAAFGVPVLTDLETGLDYPIAPARGFRQPEKPLRILWAGRLRAWKGFPVLLYALAKLPKHVQVQVRIMGDGKCKSAWIKLAKRLGVDHLLEWIPWPTYRETLQHYDWADVFAFTSLRDTSGTGILESLAAGCPVLTVNHQGVSDIVDKDSGILVPVDNLESTIQGFAAGITGLHDDAESLKRLSDGARAKAKQYHWDQRTDWTDQLYSRLIGNTTAHSPDCSQNRQSSQQPSNSSDDVENTLTTADLSGLKLASFSDFKQ